MASLREQILEHVAAALRADGPGRPAGLTVHRSRHRPIDKDALPAQCVYLVREDVAPSPDGKAARELTFAVESRATGAVPDTALDELLTWAVRQLLADATVGGICWRIEEKSTEWDAVAADKVLAAARTLFQASYHTLETDPEA